MSYLWYLYRKLFLISLLLLTALACLKQVEAADLTLTWAANSTNVDGFKIERQNGSSYAEIGTVARDVRSYTDSSVATGTTYCYQVRAFNSAGVSDPSNEACAAAQNRSLSVTPTTIASGGTITATWSGITTPTTTDWIGLFLPGAADTAYIDWIYVSCSKNPGTVRASGSCPFVVPTTVSPGTYELRLLANDGYTRLATSSTFSVTEGTGVSVSVSPTTAVSGSMITAIWSGITRPTRTDWIGVYVPGAANTRYINWFYVSCSKNPERARASGSCSSVVPSTVSPGAYELRLFANDGYTRLATSDTFTVTDRSSTVTGRSSSTVTALSSKGGNNSNSTSNPNPHSNFTSSPNSNLTTSQFWSNWTDYRVTLNMRSDADGGIGVMFRYQDNSNYYRFSWDKQRSSRRLTKLLNGTLTVLAEDAVPYVSGQTYQLEIVAQGTTLEVWIDGTQVFAVTDPSFNWGSIGLYSWFNEGSVFDHILVEDLATGAVLHWEDFNSGNFTGWTIIDEGTAYGPSSWSVLNGALVQRSNIGSDISANLGTFAVYTNN